MCDWRTKLRGQKAAPVDRGFFPVRLKNLPKIQTEDKNIVKHKNELNMFNRKKEGGAF